jgi:hypothetical protein
LNNWARVHKPNTFFVGTSTYTSEFLSWQVTVLAGDFTQLSLGKNAYDVAQGPFYDIYLRAHCQYLLYQIPDEGLEETCRTLRRYLDYYSTLPNVTPQLPEPLQLKGRFAGFTEPPPLVFGED